MAIYKKEMIKDMDFWVAVVNLAIWLSMLITGLYGVMDNLFLFIGLSSMLIAFKLFNDLNMKYKVN